MLRTRSGNRRGLLNTITPSTSVTSSPYTTLASDKLILVNNAADTTINLIAAASFTGKFLTIKDISGNASRYNITIDGNSSETIDDSTTYVMKVDYESVTLYSDGTEWWIIY